jgi:uncharacterized protein YegP (UPF0339 family)
MATVDFYQDASANKEWRWRVKAQNGEIVGASTEGYAHRDNAEFNLRSLPRYARAVDVRIAADAPHPRPEGARLPLEFYQDARDEWRWRITASNGHVVHASTEGFSSKIAARNNLQVLVEAVLGRG